jgi:hypothetical protein
LCRLLHLEHFSIVSWKKKVIFILLLLAVLLLSYNTVSIAD